MSRNPHLDVAVIRRERLVAAGARESIEYASGYRMAPKPSGLSTFGGYLLALTTIAGVLAFLARMAVR